MIALRGHFVFAELIVHCYGGKYAIAFMGGARVKPLKLTSFLLETKATETRDVTGSL